MSKCFAFYDAIPSFLCHFGGRRPFVGCGAKWPRHLPCMCAGQSLFPKNPCHHWMSMWWPASNYFQTWKAEARDAQSTLARKPRHTSKLWVWVRCLASVNNMEEQMRMIPTSTLGLHMCSDTQVPTHTYNMCNTHAYTNKGEDCIFLTLFSPPLSKTNWMFYCSTSRFLFCSDLCLLFCCQHYRALVTVA